MRMSRIAIFFLVVMLVVVACASPAPFSGGESTSPPMGAVAPSSAPMEPLASADSKAGGVVSNSVPDITQQEQRKIIYTASLTLVVADTDAVIKQITDMVEEMGGYVAQANTYHDGDAVRGGMSVRVPAERLTEALDRMEGLAVRTDQRSMGSEDATAEYTDLQARLKNLELTEVELQELLTEVREKLQSAEDVLAVYNRLTEIRGQIESIKGRMQFIDQVATMSLITITLVPDALAQPVVTPGWRPVETLRSAARSLVSGLRTVVDAAIWVVVVVVPLLAIVLAPLAVLVFALRAWARRRARRSASA